MARLDRVVITVRLSQDKRDRLNRCAARQGASVTGAVESLIDQYLVLTDPTYPVPEYLAELFPERELAEPSVPETLEEVPADKGPERAA